MASEQLSEEGPSPRELSHIENVDRTNTQQLVFQPVSMEDLSKSHNDHDDKKSPTLPDISLDREQNNSTYLYQPPVRMVPYVSKKGPVRIDRREEECTPDVVQLDN